MTGPELKRLIVKNGYTQTGLAKYLDLSPRTIRKYISGDLEIPIQSAIAIRCVLKHRDEVNYGRN